MQCMLCSSDRHQRDVVPPPWECEKRLERSGGGREAGPGRRVLRRQLPSIWTSSSVSQLSRVSWSWRRWSRVQGMEGDVVVEAANYERYSSFGRVLRRGRSWRQS